MVNSGYPHSKQTSKHWKSHHGVKHQLKQLKSMFLKM